jgi:hypothetical protein
MRRIFAFSASLALGLTLLAVPATAQDKLAGTMDLSWNGCWTGPNEAIPDWTGTIDIDGDVYDMLFWNVGTGWPPGQTPEAPYAAFNEIWAIYDGLELAFDDECAVETFEGDLVLWGHDAGLLDTETAGYEMTGTVTQAFGDFADLTDGSVTMGGTVVFDEEGNPLTAPGEFAIS